MLPTPYGFLWKMRMNEQKKSNYSSHFKTWTYLKSCYHRRNYLKNKSGKNSDQMMKTISYKMYIFWFSKKFPDFINSTQKYISVQYTGNFSFPEPPSLWSAHFVFTCAAMWLCIQTYYGNISFYFHFGILFNLSSWFLNC